jgi:protease-4
MMSRSIFSYVRQGFGFAWRALDFGRRAIFNLLFLIVLLALAWAFIFGGVKPLSEKTTLVLELKGDLVEQSASGVRDAVKANLAGGEVRRTVVLRDVINVLDAAAKDPNVGSALLLLEDMSSGGQASLREVARAVDRFKASGKKVVAWGNSYDQRQYLVAVHANEVYVHPMGGVMLEGYGRHRNYYRDALDKLGVTVNLMKVGAFKSAAEPYIANGPSPAALEAEAYLFNALWASYTDEVEKARKMPQGQIMKIIDDLPALFEKAGGDLGKFSLESKFVDGLKTRDEIRQMMIDRGARDAQGKSFRQVAFEEYLGRVRPKLMGDAVGVVMAVGEISDGIAPAGQIGGISTSNMIRAAREDKNIKAVVLRVDSPGGSAFASELIRRELELTRAAGKPVIVSMGNLAASGGYWISMSADEVIAEPNTITGSIGVFALMPTAEKVIDKLGIHTGGVTTTWLAGAGNPLRPMDPRLRQVIQTSVNHIYSDFTTRAAAARKTTPEKIDEVAQGRVWTGVQAKERGLVDRLGTYQDALKTAAEKAKLGPDHRVVYIEREVSKFDKLLEMFGGSVAYAVTDALAPYVKASVAPTGLPLGVAAETAKDLNWLNEVAAQRKPFAAVTHCLCVSP